ncbi:MAG TPA: LamG domain-containing protein [Marmoricola sp.]|nr:LamG domain-containing protein [Marmoricola sp.]
MRTLKILSLGIGALLLVPAGPSAGTATDEVATWELNDPAGSATMRDSSGHGIHGNVGDEVQTNVRVAGATAYRWTKVNPNQFPAKPERLVTVDDDDLNPGSGDYAVTVRFRTTHSAGNLMQKGQAGSRGGYFKLQNVRGKITCLFRGYDDGVRQSKAVNSGSIPLNDGAWHVITCERTADKVEMTIDGERIRRGRGPTGTISNQLPLSLGGKYNCDQVKITCDYWSGDFDYVTIKAG